MAKTLSASSLSIPTVHTNGTVNPVIPNIISFDADPNTPLISAPTGSVGLRTDVPSVYVKTSTTWVVLTASTPTSGLSLAAPMSLGDASVIASLNFSTEGTTDWFVPFNAPGNGSKWTVGGSGTGGSHEKLGGLGYLSIGAAYVSNGAVPYSVFGPVTNPSGVSTFQRSTNEDDDNCSSYLNNDTSYNAISTTTLDINNRGPGFRLVVPALATQCVLRVYTEQHLCPVTCYARLVGTSAPSQNATATVYMTDTPAGTDPSNFGKYKWAITYQSSAPAWLEVLFLITGRPSPAYHSSWLAFIGATIADS